MSTFDILPDLYTNPAAILELIRQRDEWQRQAESMASDFNMVERDRDEWKARYEFSVTVRDSLERQRDELLAAAKRSADSISYAIYNLGDAKLEELPPAVSESTCPIETGLIAEKLLREAIAKAGG